MEPGFSTGESSGLGQSLAQAIVAPAETPGTPPQRLPGSDALSFATTRLAGQVSEFLRWDALAASTNLE